MLPARKPGMRVRGISSRTRPAATDGRGRCSTRQLRSVQRRSCGVIPRLTAVTERDSRVVDVGGPTSEPSDELLEPLKIASAWFFYDVELVAYIFDRASGSYSRVRLTRV
jgi:hypothetical protein